MLTFVIFVVLQVAAVAALHSSQLQAFSNGFIVEYESPHEDKPDIVRRVAHVSDGSLTVLPKLEMASSLFHGASYMISQDNGRVTDAVLHDLVSQMSNVARVWPNRIHHLQQAQLTELDPTNYELFNSSGSPLVNPHAMTGVDRLHAAGITGKGVRIAILDTGIDASHPGLGGCYGPSCKITGGYDLVGEGPEDSDPQPDSDPRTQCNNHGTACAYIAAGMPYKYGLVGVAPDATLEMYKIYKCDGNVATDIGVNASLAAFESGVDIISLSSGGQGGWGNKFPSADCQICLWGVIASRIMAKGTLYVVAAGNDGAKGPFYANSISSTITVPSIASTDNAYSPALVNAGTYSVDGGEPIPITYSPGYPANWTMPLEIIPLQTNGCVPYPNTTYARNQVALVPRGSCDQNEFMKAAGIRNIIKYSSVDGNPLRPLPLATTENYPFEYLDGTANMDHGIAMTILDHIAKGKKVTLDLPWKPDNDSRELRMIENTFSGGFVSNFSTWGPTYEAKVQTSFSAPGGNILAAGGTNYGGLVIASGTSFSCPYAAGAAALMKQVHPDISPMEIVSRFSTTAKPLKLQSPQQRETQSFLAPVYQQGGGGMDAWAAVHTGTTVDVTDVAFNDTTHVSPVSFTITNHGTESVSYSLENVPAVTVFTFKPGNTSVTPFGGRNFVAEALAEAPASLEFSTSSFTVPAGGSTAVTVKATPPALDAARVPLYSGFIAITGSNGDSLSLPYGGIGSPLKNIRVLDSTPGQNTTYLISNTALRATKGEPSTYSPAGRHFTLSRTGGAAADPPANLSLPGFHFKTLFGSPGLGAAIVGPDGNEIAQLALVGQEDSPGGDNFVREREYEYLWAGALANGSFVESGTYRFAVGLLRIGGVPGVREDYDEVLTDGFEVVVVDAAG